MKIVWRRWALTWSEISCSFGVQLGRPKAMRRDGFTHDWYHACSGVSHSRRTWYSRARQSQFWPQPSNMTVAKILHVRESRRCDWLIEYLSKVDKLEKTEAGLAWPVGDFYNNPDASLGGIFPRKCQRFQSWGKAIRNFRGPADPLSCFRGGNFWRSPLFLEGRLGVQIVLYSYLMFK